MKESEAHLIERPFKKKKREMPNNLIVCNKPFNPYE